MYTKHAFEYTMKTMTLSLRLDAAEVKQLDETAKREGLDRSALLKRLVRLGYADHRLETACAAYRRGAVTLSRAAEMAGLSVNELLARFPEAGLQMNLSSDDLRGELAS